MAAGHRPRLSRGLVPELGARGVGTLPRRPMGMGRALGMDWVDAGPWGFTPFHYGR